jgi:holo-[acyl-carrier protein] synthase
VIPGGEVIGVGIDAVDIERFRTILGRRRGFAERVFTAAERAEAATRHDPVPGLAARFAAKEAVMKSLSVGLGAFDFADVEVVRGEGGAPALTISGRAAALAEARAVNGWHVSLTHTITVAMAVAVAYR